LVLILLASQLGVFFLQHPVYLKLLLYLIANGTYGELNHTSNDTTVIIATVTDVELDHISYNTTIIIAKYTDGELKHTSKNTSLHIATDNDVELNIYLIITVYLLQLVLMVN
jgi:hypothetical protein